jgi:hypothetical protein
MPKMSTILIDVLVGFMLVLFGAMALGPLLISARPSQPTDNTAEDRVISVSPVPMIERLRPFTEQPLHPLTGDRPGTRPDHREAA